MLLIDSDLADTDLLHHLQLTNDASASPSSPPPHDPQIQQQLLLRPDYNWSQQQEDTDWNELMVKARAMPDSTPGEQRASLAEQTLIRNEFGEVVRAMAHRLILEDKVLKLDRDDKSRRIKPLGSHGQGLAGGVKFQCGRIRFKFALDNHGIYGCLLVMVCSDTLGSSSKLFSFCSSDSY